MTENNLTCRKPYPLGAHIENGAVRFAFVSKSENCGVLIFDRRSGKRLYKLPFTEQERIGNIHCKYFYERKADEISYQFYEDDVIVTDRYARRFAGSLSYGKERKIADLRAVIPCEEFDWEMDCNPRIPYRDSLCYCAHVRGFTRHVSSGVEHRGTFLGMTEKLDYLKRTGITTVELQPVYEFSEIPTDEERRTQIGSKNASHAVSEEELNMLVPKKCNYWGYKHGYYYAPKAAYAAGEDACMEFKRMVREFHKNGMEIILQFYFPKTVKTLEITDILKYWVLEYHVDGFHLMGDNLPVDMIAADEMLSDTKLWYYYFNTDQIYPSEAVPQYKNLASYNDEYLYAMRKYLKGDENQLSTAVSQMRCIPKQTGRIHYMSNYFGFTMMDMVSYDRKHNEANGEDNRDGNDFNCSWNCGEEGSSRRKKVNALRHKQLKNAILMLLMTQSTPLIFMGDEFGNSQKGNNNPYCQDNAVTWLDWNDQNKNADIYAFWLKMVKLRKEHLILHPESEFKIMDYKSCGYPDLSYHGESAWRPRMDSYNRHIGIMYCGKYAPDGQGKEDAFFYLALNMYWESQKLALPKLPAGRRWELAVTTDECCEMDGELTIPARSCSVYMSVMDEQELKKSHRSKRRGAESYSDRSMF